MFSRLRKNFRSNESGDGSQKGSASESNSAQSEQTGFICPMCMINLPSPEALTKHFDVAHSDLDQPSSPKNSTTAESDNASGAVGDAESSVNEFHQSPKKLAASNHISKQEAESHGDELVNGAIKSEHEQTKSPQLAEVEDLQASLDEEKWYSQELKKELDRLKTEKNSLENELEMMQQQMKMAISTNEELAKQKDTAQQKAAATAQSAADAKAAKDEAEGEKANAEERCRNQSVELEKAAAWIRDLESQLIQRPGADDVMVLKKELVQVQTLMDQMTLESEKKGQEVELERQNLQQLLSEANRRAEVVQREFEQFKAENEKLKMEYIQTAAAKDESTKLFEQQKQELRKYHSENESKRQEELSSLQTSLDEQRMRNQSLEIESKRLTEEKSALQGEVDRLKNDVTSHSDRSKEYESKCAELEKALERSNSSKSDSDLKQSQIAKELERTKQERAALLAERDARLEALSEERDTLRSQVKDAQTTNEQLSAKCESLEARCEELRNSSKDREDESSSIRHQLEIEVAQLKIKLETLESENTQLVAQQRDLSSSVADAKTEHEEERNVLQRKLLEAERQAVELNVQKSQLDSDLKQKSKALNDANAQLESARDSEEDLREKLHVGNADLLLRSQEIDALKDKLAAVTAQVEEETHRREAASDEAKKLREERVELIAQMEAGEGEAAARSQLAEENSQLRLLKDEAEEKLRNQANEHKSVSRDLTSKLSESSAKILAMQEQLDAANQQVAAAEVNLAAEKQKVLQMDADLKVKSELLLNTQAASATQRADIENHLSTVKRSLDDKVKELQKVTEDASAAKSSLEGLKTQINQLRQEHSVEVAGLKSSLERSENARASGEAEVERWKEELEHFKDTARKESERKKKEWTAAETKFAEKVSNLQDALKETKKQLEAKAQELANEQEISKSARDELAEAQSTLQDLNKANATVKADLEARSSALHESDKALAKVEDALALEQKERDRERNEASLQLQEMSENLNHAHQATKSLEESMNFEMQKLRESLDCEKNKCVELDASLRAARDALLRSQAEVEESKKTISGLTLHNEEEQNKLSSEICAHLATISSLDEKLELMRSEMIGKEAESKKHQHDVADALEKLQKVSSDLEASQQREVELGSRLQQTKQELAALNASNDEMRQKNVSLDETKDDMEKELNEKVEYIRLLEAELVEKGVELEETAGKLAATERHLDTLREEGKVHAKEWKSASDQLHAQVVLLSEENSDVKSQLREEQEAREVEKNERLQEKREDDRKRQEMEEKHMNEKSDYEEKMKSLDNAQDLLLAHKAELQKMVDQLKETVEREKQLQSEAEKRAQATIQENENLLKDASSQLETAKRELETAEAERVVSESRLQLEIGALSENLNTVRLEWAGTTQKLDTASQEIENLKGQITRLQSVAQSDADERRALLERCLQSEQQVEEMQGKLNGMRRKLEDAHSALHELGRENQALQVKHTNTISRQWADDRITNQCKACGRNFSITIRKHHCRHCGDIFCNDCSSRTAAIASSKNPVRVCERCYDDLLVAS